MSRLIVYGSDSCLGWQDTLEALDALEKDPDFAPTIEVRRLADHGDEFRQLGTVICPAFVFEGEVIEVGPSNPETIKDTVARAGGG